MGDVNRMIDHSLHRLVTQLWKQSQRVYIRGKNPSPDICQSAIPLPSPPPKFPLAALPSSPSTFLAPLFIKPHFQSSHYFISPNPLPSCEPNCLFPSHPKLHTFDLIPPYHHHPYPTPLLFLPFSSPLLSSQNPFQFNSLPKFPNLKHLTTQQKESFPTLEVPYSLAALILPTP